MFTTTSVKGSHLLHAKDLISSEFFLTDSGAGINIVKVIPSEKRFKAHCELIFVDGTPVSTYGNHTLNLCFSGVSKFVGFFVIADNNNNILGIDFLRHFSLTIDFANSKFRNHLSQSLFSLATKLVGNTELRMNTLKCLRAFLISHDRGVKKNSLNMMFFMTLSPQVIRVMFVLVLCPWKIKGFSQ